MHKNTYKAQPPTYDSNYDGYYTRIKIFKEVKNYYKNLLQPSRARAMT